MKHNSTTLYFGLGPFGICKPKRSHDPQKTYQACLDNGVTAPEGGAELGTAPGEGHSVVNSCIQLQRNLLQDVLFGIKWPV